MSFRCGKSRVLVFLAFQFSVCCLHTIFLGMRRQSLLTRVYARLPWDFVLFAFTTFTRRVVESHQSKVKQPCSLMCVEELFCPLATHFWRVLLKYVRKYRVTSWYIVGYMGCLWRLWKQKVQNSWCVRVRVRVRKLILTSSSSLFSAYLCLSPSLRNLSPLRACAVGRDNHLTS